MLFLTGYQAEPNPKTDQALRASLERALQNVPLQGPAFRMVAAKAAFPFVECGLRFSHPIGKPDSIIITFDFRDNPIYVVFKQHGKLHVESILRPYDYDSDGAPPYDVMQAAWSKGRLFTLLRFEGGTGNSDYGRVYELRHNRWKMVQQLDTLGENAFQGDRNHRRIVNRDPVDLRDTFLVRYCVDPDASHASMDLLCRESWRFHNGRLQRTKRQRVQTPYAALIDLFKAVDHHQRRQFDAVVAPALRAKAWHALVNARHTTEVEADWPWNDKSSHLVVDNSVHVIFTRQHGRWILTSIRTQKRT